MNKILSISVAAYNAANDIKRCLDSMLNTKVADDLEIIVVNDGSKDNTAEIVSQYVRQYPDIVKLIDKPNGGHGSTINASLQIASGKYYKIVDSDDWVDKDGIEKLVNHLKSIDADLVLNPFYEIDADTKNIRNRKKPYQDDQIINSILPMDTANGIVLMMHSITFKTSVVQAMGPVISEKCFYVDMEYTIFPIPYVHSYICLDYPVYHYLLGTATQSMNRNNLIARREQHLRVVNRIVLFYRDHKDQMKGAIREIVLHRVRIAVLTQYKIYFVMDPNAAISEVIHFDKWLKDTDQEVYKGVDCKIMKVMKANRLTGFSGYKATSRLLRMLNWDSKL